MKRLSIPSRGLVAPAALALSLGLAGAPAAQAASGFSYQAAAGNFQVTQTHQSTSFLKREAKNNAGALIETVVCRAPAGNCFLALPAGTATYAVSLEGFNGDREEVVAESCKGVVSAVPQRFCVGGDLRMTLRVRTGAIGATVALLPVAPGQVVDLTGSTMRLEFVDDATRYWELPAGSRTVAPAGNFRVTSQDLRAPCKPTQTNAGVVLDIPPNGTGTTTLSYRRTQCSVTVTVRNSDTVAGGTVTADAGPLACGDPLRLTNTCTGTFAADTTVRFSGRAAAGYRAVFNGNALTTACNYPLAALDQCDVRAVTDASVLLETSPGSAPPPPPAPPPAVTLALSAGTATPADAPAAKGATDVPVLQLRATPGGGTALIHALTLRASGSGRDDLDLPTLRVVLDSNGNGRADAGEPVLGQGRPTVDNGSVRIGLSTPLALTAAAHVLVVADVSNTVHTAAAVGTGGGLALATLLLWPGRARRRSVQMAQLAVAAVIAACLLAACGGGEAGAPEAAVAPAPAPVPSATPDVAPVVVTLNYRIELTGVDATDDASPALALDVAELPIAGALITVTQ